MSINYGYLFTYGEDGKKLPEKRNLKRAIDNSIYEGVGERDLKIKVFDETLHLIIETTNRGSCVKHCKVRYRVSLDEVDSSRDVRKLFINSYIYFYDFV